MTPHEETLAALKGIENAINALVMSTTLTMYYNRPALQTARNDLHPKHKGPNSMLWYIGQYVRSLTYSEGGL